MLKWNVFYQEGNKIITRDIFKYDFLLEFLKKEYKKYKKELKSFAKQNRYIYDGKILIESGDKKYEKFLSNYVNNVFGENLKKELKYYFWAKTECEIVLTDVLPTITKEEFERLKNDYREHPYRYIVNLETEKKVDIWDQIELNWDVFLHYVWDNLDNIKKVK